MGVTSVEVGLTKFYCMSSRTFRGLDGKSPVLDHPDLMLRDVSAMSRARLYSSVKWALLTVSAPPRYKESTCSR